VPFKLSGGENCASVPGFTGKLCMGAPKNCGRVNGEYLCVEGHDYSGAETPPVEANKPHVICKEDILGFEHCFTNSEGVEISRGTTTSTDPNGTVTTIEKTCNNVEGDSCTTTTCTTPPAGQTSCVTTGGGPGGAGNTNGTNRDVEKAVLKAECEKEGNKGTAGCAKLEETAPTPETIRRENVQSSLQVGGYSSGSCPAPQSISISRGSYSMSYQPLCDLASGTKPILIAMAYLAAGYIVLGSVKG